MSYTEPLLTLFLAITLFGLFRRPKQGGTALAVAGVIGLFLSAWPPADWLFSRPLEVWYPVKPFHGPAAQAIVVFSAGVDPPHFERPYSLPDDQTYDRCLYAAWVSHQSPGVPVLACGGPATPGGQPLSWAMRQILSEAGVPAANIWTEERSTSTHENAVFGAEILRRHGITSVILVVNATSMPRASASLRKAGIQVVPAPSEFRDWDKLRDEILPSWKAVRRNEATLHEIGGLGWYWLKGWI